MRELGKSPRDTRPLPVRVYEQLRDLIVSGELDADSQLVQEQVADSLGVSRTPVREALRHLASSGLVEIRKNQGAAVRRLTTTELIEMFQVMAEFEGLSARLSARRMSIAEIDEMRRHHNECTALAEGRDYEGFFAANNLFHEAIFLGSKNEFLHAEARKLRNRVNVYRRHITGPRIMHKSVEEHAGIVDAICAGDVALAGERARAHVRGSRENILRLLQAKSDYQGFFAKAS